ncbi:hypothetical protein TBR22_A46200 [Luteitalea sp. TBR-22]|nr:hypothetical protein TBR22_A46200 [Luteitalea sp. TBR-22]
MRRLSLIVALSAAAVCPQAPRAQESTFRASVDVVRIDAFAHRDQQPVTGLTARDFVVRDNGVEQQVDAIGTTDSAHVVVGLDVSASVDGETLAQLRAGVAAVLATLTPRDRVSVFTFADQVRILARVAQPQAGLDARIGDLAAAGSTSLHDALVVGSVLARADERPCVFLLFTDGHDTGSWSSTPRVFDILRRTNVVVFPVGAGLPRDGVPTRESTYFYKWTWTAPAPSDTRLLLERVADTTGGAFLRIGRGDRLADTFARILASYRQRYLISYTPTGVRTDDGWHRLEVRLRSRPGAVVAREGYMARQP